ncbi:MAG: L-2-hydroxyglutarate oxidase [Bacteroidetes bacterium]|nr:L-2-hydroxyglutarate oxidase [Bacteroidota bacterium]MBV6462431.1 L-2-hydroxyglutarate oxidase LhgO [Flavobacteriales bacterium]WKZ74402.1 MAG: L-2-hydroxyglutarate oxidase [Vicingaceae bacterium]MCL4816979.1 L-2-hydroxyglutarate oxidase [Flavobacteriales bacterium]NOG94658.1 L-2-hydroxyglutarate oxidase [Bacteroidota bacterium]
MFDITIVGGGIVGAATAYKIQKEFPELKILIIEKEKKLANHQTGNNSGVIHSGLYYKPGSKKAINCVLGRKELVAFAKEHNIAHDVCGKVVVAVSENELLFMDKIFQNGIENGVEGIEKINAQRIKEIEPFSEGIAGIWVPCTGIIDYRGTTEKLVELTLNIQSGSKIVMSEEVLDFENISSTEKKVITDKNFYNTKFVIVCGGLQADRLAKKDGVKIKEKVVGFRGDYYELTHEAKHKVKNLIYPVPNPDFPFLGVHFTRMVDGEIECGPNAVFTFKREGYGKTDFSLKDTFDALCYSGTWRLFFSNMKFGIDEYRRAFSKKLFLKTLQRIIPSLTMDDIKPGRSGVRALLLREDGDTRDDFRIEYKQNSIHVLNAPSPAATACLAIGNDIKEMAKQHFKL